MYIKSLHVEGFRSIQNQTLTFEPRLTTLVGENNTGKSIIGLAIKKLFTQCATGREEISITDYPYGIVGPLTIEAALRLSHDEVEKHLLPPLVSGVCSAKDESPLCSWLLRNGNDITLFVRREDDRMVTGLRWGELQIIHNNLIVRSATDSSQAWTAHASRIHSGHLHGDELQRLKGTFSCGTEVIQEKLGPFVHGQYKLAEEFRVRSVLGERTAAVESMGGSETAGVLLTLKNHRVRREQDRYTEVVKAFSKFFLHYTINAVEQEPRGAADIQFYEKGRTEPLSLANMSSGVHEFLTLLTDLIAREDLVIFWEHPETHLHPHSMRSAASLLEASERNQIIVTTHDPHFVNPKSPQSLRRFWWVRGLGTQIRELDPSLSQTKLSQIATALRHLGDREVVFARAVILVEDETLTEFLIGVAPKLGRDIDANSVSVVFTGGEGGHRPFHTLLDALGIPYVHLRDRNWGHNPRFPPDRFFSLDAEFEEYLDKQGLGAMLEQVKEEAGRSKRRWAVVLASRIPRKQIPTIFDHVLARAISLASGEPAGK